MTNPLRELEAPGQSVWLDDIDREHLRSGLFERLISEDGLSGATGNSTIFEHSIDHGTVYDEQMRQLIAQGKNAQAIYETLAMIDVRHVADLLRPTYERTAGRDGFVSIEVSLYLAHDTERTLGSTTTRSPGNCKRRECRSSSTPSRSCLRVLTRSARRFSRNKAFQGGRHDLGGVACRFALRK